MDKILKFPKIELKKKWKDYNKILENYASGA